MDKGPLLLFDEGGGDITAVPIGCIETIEWVAEKQMTRVRCGRSKYSLYTTEDFNTVCARYTKTLAMYNKKG